MEKVVSFGIQFYILIIIVSPSSIVHSQSTTIVPSSGTVSLPPSITINPPSSYVFNIQKPAGGILLPCGAIGTPMPTYSWTQNGALLTIDGQNIQQKSQGSILIASPSSSDQGYYECTATNTWGVSLSTTSFLQMAQINQFTSTGGTTVVYQGNPAILQCSPPTSVPNATYSWVTAPSTNLNDVTTIAPSARIAVDQQGDLLFANAEAIDNSGQNVYMCAVLNAFLSQTQYGPAITLTVQPATPNNTAPFAVNNISPSPTNTVLGQSVSLFCFFNGYPTPTITWPTSLPAGRYTLTNNNSTLTISNIQQSDEMSYTCQGQNSMGTASVSIKINVNIAPYFQSTADQPTNLNATSGQTVSFICKAQAIPSAQIVWYQNGQSLQPTNLPSKFSLSPDLTNLTISNVCKVCSDGSSDLMVIQCNISNSYGYAFAQGYLNVLDQTTITSSPTNQVLGSSSVLTFYCSATSDPSTPVSIFWYFNDQNITYNSYIYTDSSGNLLINTNEAPNGGKNLVGTYTCVAWNGYSSANASAQLEAAPPTVQSAGSYWYVFLILGLLLLLLLFLLCWWCHKYNEEDTYPVDKEEQKNGNDPVKELQDNDFQAYQRANQLQQTGNRNSWQSVQFGSEPNASIAGYSNIDGGKFNEEGSFIGQYAQQNPLKSAARLATNEEDGLSNVDMDRGYSSMDRHLDIATPAGVLAAVPEHPDIPDTDSRLYLSPVRNPDGTRSPGFDDNQWPDASGLQYDNDLPQYPDAYNPGGRPQMPPPPPPPPVRYTTPAFQVQMTAGSQDGGSVDGRVQPVSRRRSRHSPGAELGELAGYNYENPSHDLSASLAITGPAGNQITFTSNRNLNENGQEYLDQERYDQPYGDLRAEERPHLDMNYQGSAHSMNYIFDDIGGEATV